MTASSGSLERGAATIRWWQSVGSADAPTMILLHGGAMDHQMWDAQVAAFSGGYRVVTYDMRGHGASRCPAADMTLDAARDDLCALMDELGVERGALVGHSVGATVAQLVALQAPRRVSALVCIGGVCATIAPPAAARLRQAINPLALRLLGQRRVREMFADMAGLSESVKEYARDAISALDDDAFEAVMRTGFGRPQSVGESYALGLPLLLLRGDKEPYSAFMGATPKWASRDQARQVVVPEAAHNANQDAPDFVNERIGAFLAGVGV